MEEGKTERRRIVYIERKRRDGRGQRRKKRDERRRERGRKRHGWKRGKTGEEKTCLTSDQKGRGNLEVIFEGGLFA